MARPPAAIVLSEEEKAELDGWSRRRNTRAGLHPRAGVVLDCARGYTGEEVAKRHHTSQQTVSKWQGRFARERLAGLSDAVRSGQPRKHNDARVQEVLDATLNRWLRHATHWSVRSLSEDLAVPRDFVHRVWRAFGLKPHLSRNFKLSTDPHFIDKVRDVVGLYLNPPDKALVLCVDEKSQIQALDRTHSSWMNLVERFFATLTEHQLRRGTHRSVVALEKAIRHYLDLHNQHPKPFRWTKSR